MPATKAMAKTMVAKKFLLTIADYGEDHAGYAGEKEDVVQGIGIEGTPVEKQIRSHEGCHDGCRYVVEPGLHEGRKLS